MLEVVGSLCQLAMMRSGGLDLASKFIAESAIVTFGAPEPFFFGPRWESASSSLRTSLWVVGASMKGNSGETWLRDSSIWQLKPEPGILPYHKIMYREATGTRMSQPPLSTRIDMKKLL